MARYSLHYEEMRYLMVTLDSYDVEYEIEHDDIIVFDEYGESIAERVVHYIREYPYERYLIDKARLIDEGADPRCIMSYYATIAYEEWQADLGDEQLR